MEQSQRRAGSVPSREEAWALDFGRDLSRTLGGPYRVGIYRLRPPRLLAAWGGAARRPSDERAMKDLLLEFAEEGVVNRAAGPGGRVTVLPLPPRSGGRPALALTIEVDGAALARAARLLGSIADPGREVGEAEEIEHLGEALDRLLAEAEVELGVRAGDMSRSQKQGVVKYLDERGAFLIKKSVEQVAARLGVSRFTIYNYLDESNRDE